MKLKDVELKWPEYKLANRDLISKKKKVKITYFAALGRQNCCKLYLCAGRRVEIEVELLLYHEKTMLLGCTQQWQDVDSWKRMTSLKDEQWFKGGSFQLVLSWGVFDRNKLRETAISKVIKVKLVCHMEKWDMYTFLLQSYHVQGKEKM